MAASERRLGSGSSSSRSTTMLGGASIPRRTLSPETRTTVTTIESPKRIRSASFRDKTSMEVTSVYEKRVMMSELFVVALSLSPLSPFAPRTDGLSQSESRRWLIGHFEFRRRERRCSQQACFVNPLALRVVKQDRIAVGFPDG